MNRLEFLRLIGAKEGEADYVPVACFLRNGSACAGYYNSAVNEGLEETCVLLNARLVECGEHSSSRSAHIDGFHSFLEEIVTHCYQPTGEPTSVDREIYGPSIPLTAIAFGEINILYPVAHIATLMKRMEKVEESPRVPSFLDIDNKSIIIKLLRTKLW